MKKKIFLLFVSLFVIPGLCFASSLSVIANKNIKESSMSKSDIKKIFLSKKKSLSSGSVKITIQKNESLNEQFLKEYVKKSPSQYSSYYKKLVFTGKGKAPKEVADDQSMISYVSNTPGAIGYVSSGAANDTVKIIKVQ